MKIKSNIIKCAIALLFLFLSSCKTIETTSNKYITDTCYITRYTTDSIWIKDSVWVKDSGDTILIKEWHTKYIDKSRIDTFYSAHIDTCYIENTTQLPQERYIPSWIWWLLGITGLISIIVIVKIIIKIKSGGLLS